MSNLQAAENDADKNFWYEPVGAAVQPCSSDPPRKIVSEDKKHWIEIALVDENGDPVPGVSYEIKLPDGTLQTGNLDSRGLARIDGIDPGTCRVSFPDFDKGAWKVV
jgi:hypothetical protein